MIEKKILLIDDDPELCQLIENIFLHKNCQVILANNGECGIQRLKEYNPDLILLDIMMPIMDGWTTLRNIREHSSIPVIILSALGQEKDIVRGLEAGADDYIVKPFSYKILLARTVANLRRTPAGASENSRYDYADGYLNIGLADGVVMAGGERVNLTPTEFSVLAYLVNHTGRTRTFSQILENVWGDKNMYHAEYVHVYISRLRQKLEPELKNPVYILSEHGIGYRFT